MPSGPKRRKAAKNKSKKDSNNNHHHHHVRTSSSNTTSQSQSQSQSHGTADPKPVDARESDREEEAKSGGEEAMEVVDQQEPQTLEEEIVPEVEMDSKPPENASKTSDFSSVDVVAKEETPVVPLTSEESVPLIDVAQDKDIPVVEEEKSVISSAADEEVPKAVAYIPEEGVVGIGADPVEEIHKSVEENIRDDELIKEEATLAQQVIPGAESSVMITDVVNSELMKNADSISRVSDDREMLSSSTDQDGQSEKTESQVVSLDEDKFLGAAIVNNTRVEVEASSKQVEEQVVASATPITQVVDSVQNGETLMQLHEHVGAPVVSMTSREVDNTTESETQKLLEEKPLIASNPLPVRRTSWLGCCGLFEVFSGANR